MKVMVTLTGPFEGTDPTDAEVRTFTTGEFDPRELPRSVAFDVYHQVARLAGVDDPLPLCESDEAFARRLAMDTAAQHPDIIPAHAPDDPMLWEDLADVA